MGASYILLLTAFYVDNGKNLPLWRELPEHCVLVGAGRDWYTGHDLRASSAPPVVLAFGGGAPSTTG